jgi:predicted nucleic acid-binding protein
VIFLDTSAIYAIADQADPNHASAMALVAQAQREGESFLVHNYVLVESTALLQRRLGLESALLFIQESERFRIHWVGAREHREAVELLRERGRRGLSLVDCVSFVVMREEGVLMSLAFDTDFEREGFSLYSSER